MGDKPDGQNAETVETVAAKISTAIDNSKLEEALALWDKAYEAYSANEADEDYRPSLAEILIYNHLRAAGRLAFIMSMNDRAEEGQALMDLLDLTNAVNLLGPELSPEVDIGSDSVRKYWALFSEREDAHRILFTLSGEYPKSAYELITSLDAGTVQELMPENEHSTSAILNIMIADIERGCTLWNLWYKDWNREKLDRAAHDFAKYHTERARALSKELISRVGESKVSGEYLETFLQ